MHILTVDPFATKGIEYLLVLFFLPALVVFWRFLGRNAVPAPMPARATLPATTRSGWFRLPEDRYYHPGHAWALPAAQGVVTVGIDDFAQKLVGRAQEIQIPEVGARVEQGSPGCTLKVESQSLDVLSPVGGEVVARNETALRSPGLLNRSPYGEGWLMKIRPSRMQPNLRNLLAGSPARAWMESVEAGLRAHMSGQLGQVLQDGGFPISGIARGISPENWDEVAREFLLTR